MSQKTDAQLTTGATTIKNATAPGSNSPTRVGQMLIDLVDSKTNKADIRGYRGGWNWSANANADPPWNVGDWGESVGDRGTPDDPTPGYYVQDGALIFKTSTGFKFL